MKTSSAKAKGRRLQQTVRDKILSLFPTLELDVDVRSAIMGETGEDIKLSKKAFGFGRRYPIVQGWSKNR